MQKILNYYQVSDKIATSGQPTQEQFDTIAKDGYKIIINLALASSSNAVPEEDAIVTDLGMVYIHLPVLWDAPQIDDVQIFCHLMNLNHLRKVWVHCAKNMRVSCFMYLYQKHILKMSEEKASYPMNKIWQPQGVWQELMQKEFNENKSIGVC